MTAAGALVLACVLGGVFGPIGPHVARFIGLFWLTGLLGLSLFVFLPEGWAKRRQVYAILGLAVLARLALLPHPASDDLNRCVWEGRVLAAGRNPYVCAPKRVELQYLRDGHVWPGISHPDRAAYHPPLMLMLFSITSRVGSGVLAAKLMIISADIAALLCLLCLLQRRRLSVRWSLLYAANPLVLYAFAGQGHLDAIYVALVCGTLLLYDRRDWTWMFAAAGLAVQTRYVALLMLPFLLRRDNWRRAWVALPLMLCPFLLVWTSRPSVPFRSLEVFALHTAFGGSVHNVLRTLLGSIEQATAACAGLGLSALVWCAMLLHPARCEQHQDDPVPALLVVYTILLVLAPTVHFWYLTWVLPFVVLRPQASWLVLSFGTIAAYFLVYGVQLQTGKWLLPTWALAAMWGPFWVLLCAEVRLGWRRLYCTRARSRSASATGSGSLRTSTG